MRKLIFPLLLVVMVLTSACGGAATQAPTSQPTERTAPTVVVSESTDSAPTGPEAGCTVVSRRPTPGPTQQSIFPPVGEDDWAKGPADAKVTIIEYSDFQ